MEFRAFGGIEVLDGDRTVDLGPRMHKAVLAILLVSAGQVIPADQLIDQLWGGDPPAAAEGAVQECVSSLRRALEPRRPPRSPPRLLLTQPPGYLLRLTPSQFDVARFETLCAEGRATLVAGPARLRAGRDALVDALALSRGSPYLEFAAEAWIGPELTRLGELRAAAQEDLAEVRLALGEWSSTARAGTDDGSLEVVSDLGRRLVGLTANRVTVGRSSASDIHLPDSTVARNHAAIERAAGGWAVRDLGSNGTLVNGRALGDAGHVLQPGDEIAVGGARLFFRSRAQDAASETVGTGDG